MRSPSCPLRRGQGRHDRERAIGRRHHVRQQELSSGQTAGELPSAIHFGTRAYRVEHTQIVGSTPAALEARYASARLFDKRLRRGASVLELHPTLTRHHGDELVISARRAVFLNAEREIGPEIDDPSLLFSSRESVAVVITNPDVSGKSIGELVN